MPKIEFTETLHVGIEAIDAQHKQLILLIHQMAEELENDSGSQHLSAHLSEMMNYALKHLVYEERLLQKHGYPDFETHCDEHHAFREKTVELFALSKTDTETAANLMYDYLLSWLIEHILNTDMAYKPFLKECGVS